ncbi:hypothetical protein F8388_025979 [Cannabis sativa]|uniref:Uncharacterized protein n=1 Tax=Cannabis sativa TaxID=3483 RepID=A0A7J6EC87_CANSA|nr:hypothetical protein F8388_025979 [Cannabis sativa]
MNNITTNTNNLTAAPATHTGENFVFFRHLQTLGDFAAIFVFIAIHSLRQRENKGYQCGQFLACYRLWPQLYNPQHETWQRQRKTASIEFHSAKFRNLTTESLRELVHQRLLTVLDDSVQKLTALDLQEVLLRLTFDNVCMIAFGVDPGCLQKGLPEIPFAKAFEDATEATIFRKVNICTTYVASVVVLVCDPPCLWKLMRYLNIGTEKKLKESLEGVDVFAEDVDSDKEERAFFALR